MDLPQLCFHRWIAGSRCMWFLFSKRGFYFWASRHCCHITSRAVLLHVCSSISSLPKHYEPPCLIPMYLCLPRLNSSLCILHVLSVCPASLFCPSPYACSFLYLFAHYSFLKHPIPSPLSSKPLSLNPQLPISNLSLLRNPCHHSLLHRKTFSSQILCATIVCIYD